MQLIALLTLGLPLATVINDLNLAAYTNSPDRSTKSTTSHLNVLCVLVNTRFQVLFTPLPGFFSPFPHGTASLSVTGEYFGLEGGPPCFPRDSSCPAVLWIQSLIVGFRLPDYHCLRCAFPCASTNLLLDSTVRNPEDIATLGLASSAFARHYSQNLG